MPRASANGIELEYDLTGDPSHEPLLLVMGLGAQMIAWPDAFVAMLADRGHYVIRYDNRDVGLSTKLDSAPPVNLPEVMRQVMAGERPDAPYRVSDMADDAAGLLDALGLESAHVVGASMGGAIVQQLAISHSKGVRSVCSIMSTTGHPGLPQGRPEALQRLMTPAPTERQAYIEMRVDTGRFLNGSGFPFDEERARELAARGFDRCFHPEGVQRQLVAVMASGSRRDALGGVTAPALVIHGTDDPLVPVEGGIDTHEAIPGSELLLVDGMGHALPQGAWPTIVDAIAKHTAAAR